jgi:hypothetical protein
MRVRIQVTVESESDAIPVAHEVATLERGPLQPEGLGLTLAEAKALLRGVQETMVAAQVAAFEARQEGCPNCSRQCQPLDKHLSTGAMDPAPSCLSVLDAAKIRRNRPGRQRHSRWWPDSDSQN